MTTAAPTPTPATAIPTAEEATGHLAALKGAYRAALEAGDPVAAWRLRQEKGQAEEVLAAAKVARAKAEIAVLEHEVTRVEVEAAEALTGAERARDANLAAGGLPESKKVAHQAAGTSANAAMRASEARETVMSAKRDLAALIDKTVREGWSR